MSTSSTRYAALLLRVSLGLVLLAHGLTKVFVFTPAGTAKFFESVGFSGWMAYPVMAFEVIGGLFLIAGILTPYIAALSFFVLFGAATVHFGNGWGFGNPGGGWEYPIYLAITSVVLALLRSNGAYSLKGLLSSSSEK